MTPRAPKVPSNSVAHNGPSTAPSVSIARSKPKARPVCSGATQSASSVSRDGPRLPRPIHPNRAKYQNGRPAMRERVTERGDCRCEVADDAGRSSPSRAVRDEAARELCKARQPVGNALDHAQRYRRRAQARKKRGENRGRGLVSPIGEKAGQTDAENAARKPALRRRRWGDRFAHGDEPAVLSHRHYFGQHTGEAASQPVLPLPFVGARHAVPGKNSWRSAPNDLVVTPESPSM